MFSEEFVIVHLGIASREGPKHKVKFTLPIVFEKMY